MDKINLRDILLGVLSVAGIVYIINQLLSLVQAIFKDVTLALIKSLLIVEVVLILVAGLYIWKKIKLSDYFSKTFIILLAIIVVLKLAHYLLVIF